MSQTNLSDSRKDISMGYFPNKCAPERPPPPKYNSRLSMENLSSGVELNLNSNVKFRDRSISPSRFSSFEQKPYNVYRSTSPLGMKNHSELSLSRSGSRTSLNHSYPLQLSREASPIFSRSPSPLRNPHFSL